MRWLRAWREPRGAELTSDRGAGVRGAVHLPPSEARADLAGLVVWDPGFQELRENKVQKGPRTLRQTALEYREVSPPPLARPPPSQDSVRATQTDAGRMAVSILRRKVLEAPERQPTALYAEGMANDRF